MLPTPDATMAPNQNANTNGPKSVAEVAKTNWLPGKMWRTPDTDAAGRGEYKDTEKIKTRWEKGHQITLSNQVKMWPTPKAANPGSRPNGKGGKILAEEVAISEGLRKRGETLWPTPTEQGSAKQTGSLNPGFVCWLMGYPTDWMDGIAPGPKNRKASRGSPAVSKTGSTS
ncbi:MAG: hypothetical protein L6437_02575 [Kiritimatiellae bacterium]|nr:hypothetical protein [Kiritimatiellia bacterium]